MVKLSIFEKYAELPKFWQRNLNHNDESTNTKKEKMDVTEERADDQQTSYVSSDFQEKANIDHKMANQAGNEETKVDCTAHSSMQNTVTESITNIGYDAEEETLAKDPVGALMSLCDFAHTQVKPLTYNEILESSNCKVLSDTQDRDTEGTKNVVSDDNFENRDTTETSLQEVSFMSTYEYTNVQGESSAMDDCEVTPTGTPEGPVEEEVDPTPGADDLYNSDHEYLKDFGNKGIYCSTLEDEMEESEDKYAGHWKICMKNEVRMVISKAKRKTKSPKEKIDDEFEGKTQRKRIKLKLRLS